MTRNMSAKRRYQIGEEFRYQGKTYSVVECYRLPIPNAIGNTFGLVVREVIHA